MKTKKGIIPHILLVLGAGLIIALGMSTPLIKKIKNPFPSLGQDVVTRGYYLSSTAIQDQVDKLPFFTETRPPEYTLSNLAQDVDIVTIDPGFYGILWDEFAISDTPPPSHPWTQLLESKASEVASIGKPVFLNLDFSRADLTDKAINNGGTLETEAWGTAGHCYDFSQQDVAGSDANKKKTAFINHVKWLTTKFSPKYINVAIEINDFWENCQATYPGRWDHLVNVQRAAYDAAKSVKPDAIVFPSIMIDMLYDDSLTGFNQNDYNALANLKRDRFAISTYPYGLRVGSRHAIPSEIPADYFTRAGDRGGERTVFAETGWLSDNLIYRLDASNCYNGETYSLQEERDYLDLVLNTAQSKNMDFVMWWSNRDLMPATAMTTCYPNASGPSYSACNGDLWCNANNQFRQVDPANPSTGDILFKAFGTMGVRDYNGSTKGIVWDRWQQALSLPVGGGGGIPPSPPLSTPSPSPTPFASPTPTPSATGDGLTGSYFDNSDLTNLKSTRVDSTVNFDWGNKSPITGMGRDTFSVRWTGFVVPKYTQTYTFYTRTDDGVRLWVNGQLIVDYWINQSTTERSGTIALSANQRYEIKMEYFDNTGNAKARLSWSSASQSKQVIPKSQLFSK